MDSCRLKGNKLKIKKVEDKILWYLKMFEILSFREFRKITTYAEEKICTLVILGFTNS